MTRIPALAHLAISLCLVIGYHDAGRAAVDAGAEPMSPFEYEQLVARSHPRVDAYLAERMREQWLARKGS